MAFEVTKTRAAFPILATRVHGLPLCYLDNAATSQTPNLVLEAMARHERTSRANIHRGNHWLADAATDGFDRARAAVARYINAASPDEQRRR